MKNALKITINKVVDNTLKETKTKYHCGYCESGQVYSVKRSDTLYCRICGKQSKLKLEVKQK